MAREGIVDLFGSHIGNDSSRVKERADEIRPFSELQIRRGNRDNLGIILPISP